MVNKRECTWLLFGVLSLLEAQQVWASEIEGSRIYRSAYYLGRGDTGIAAADDHEAIFYNPAGLARGKGLYKETVFASPTLVISNDTKDLARKYLVEEDNSASTLREHVGKNQHVELNNFSGIVFRRAALGAMVSSANNVLLYKSPENRAVEVLDADSTTNVAGTFSMAEGFFNQFLLVGTTIKYVAQTYSEVSVNVIDSSNISDQLGDSANQSTYSGLGADLGMMLQWDGRSPFSLGLTIENVGGLKLISDTEGVNDRSLPQTINAGAAIDTGTKLSRLKFFLDVRDLSNQVSDNFLLKTHIGGELSFANFFGMTFGINQGYPGVGAFVDAVVFRTDIGVYTQEMGSFAGSRGDTRLYLRLVTGI
ncbi:conjugal transfer protein TraF [Pseudobacteriovorax antillogorgiicola]|uniref:Plasmid transfer operon, TraF, protein n=1 Tax=Pseudobacteriovorax antillogorgiicola TaxID=1513793 RepID=A0A1Y6BNX9_9BACT|nr:conjugal transfer protein TraF [Pseudobacteriovorax antillogorgiicola]TCS53821.1 F plasmid transfer operon protein TraF [Pseudobacteriovorax antillogorgiicola]SMF21857.1 plasmid transfer operon, TraF, protein [Pseudobacteriovorax antillogorgiicola]